MEGDDEEMADDKESSIADDDDAAAGAAAAGAAAGAAGGAKTTGDTDDDKADELANEDVHELEEVRKEQMELMQAEREALEKEAAEEAAAGGGTFNKIDYLIKQSDVFAHFLAGSVAIDDKKKKKKGKKGGRGAKKGRMTEAQEDAQLMKTAQSHRRTIRLDKQPGNLASHCKMHAYQLEGLNWLIKLHDHGINGILADEMGESSFISSIFVSIYL